MKNLIGYVLLFVGGAFLGGTGLDPLDLHWWAIVMPLIIGSDLT